MKKETVEEFIKRGGKVTKIPRGVRCSCPLFRGIDFGFNKYSCRNREGGIHTGNGAIHHRFKKHNS